MSEPVRTRASSVLGVVILLVLGLTGAALVGPRPVRAQSILGAGGLGFPVEPVGARARGMGSLGVGLFGASLLPGDPAVSRDLQVPMITATYEPSWSTYTLGGDERSVPTSRFPLIGVAYPVSALDGMATLTFGSFLDANWVSEQERTVDLGRGDVTVTDRFSSEGGISALRLGWSQDLHETLDVAVAAGSYLGDVERVLRRDFATPSDAPAPLENYQVAGKWRFTGPTVTLGATWDPSDLIRVAGSVDWSGSLTAEPASGTEGPERTIDLPTSYRFGASGALSSRLSVNVGVSYADWSVTSDDLARSSTVGEVWSYGGGVEWDGMRFLDRRFPVRLGYRTADLPFRFQGAAPTESAFAVGLGMNLLEAQELPLAVIDLSLEMGSREAGSFTEDFQRAAISVRVAGN